MTHLGFQLPMWVVYDHPIDFPHWYVAKNEIVGDLWPESPLQYIFDRDLERLRVALGDKGLVRTPRHPADPPVIMEVWI